MSTSELDRIIEDYHESLSEFVKGNPEPQKRLWSRRDDVTLANPLGPPVKGWVKLSEELDRAASMIRDGEPSVCERIVTYETSDLAFILELERFRIKVGPRQEFASGELRVTSIFRHEDDGWKLLHRHADNISSPRSADSLIHQ